MEHIKPSCDPSNSTEIIDPTAKHNPVNTETTAAIKRTRESRKLQYRPSEFSNVTQKQGEANFI